MEPVLAGDFISGKYSVTSESAAIKKMEFKADGTVDVTLTTFESQLKNGKWSQVPKISTVRCTYGIGDLKSFDVDDLERELSASNPNDPKVKLEIGQLRSFKAKNYEAVIVITGNVPESIFVKQGSELVSIPKAYVYKKTYW